MHIQTKSIADSVTNWNPRISADNYQTNSRHRFALEASGTSNKLYFAKNQDNAPWQVLVYDL